MLLLIGTGSGVDLKSRTGDRGAGQDRTGSEVCYKSSGEVCEQRTSRAECAVNAWQNCRLLGVCGGRARNANCELSGLQAQYEMRFTECITDSSCIRRTHKPIQYNTVECFRVEIKTLELREHHQ